MKANVVANLSQTGGVSDKVLIHLKKNGKMRKLERWVPHELKEANRQTALIAALLLKRQNNEGL